MEKIQRMIELRCLFSLETSNSAFMSTKFSSKKGNIMTLFDKEFPNSLVERCKRITHEKTATKAVKEALELLFRNNETLTEMRRELATTEEANRQLIAAMEAKDAAEKQLADALKFAKDPAKFALEAEKAKGKKIVGWH